MKNEKQFLKRPLKSQPVPEKFDVKMSKFTADINAISTRLECHW